MIRQHRSLFYGLVSIALIPGFSLAGPISPDKGKADDKSPLIWYDVQLVGVEGQGWKDVKSPYDRLPGRAEGQVTPAVWSLSRDSAGMCVRFATDAKEVHARWALNKKNLALAHMPATGVSGVDLYAQDKDGKYRWVMVGKPGEFPVSTASLVSGLPPGKRNYMLYFPLYNGVTSVEIGLPKGATLYQPEPRVAGRDKPVIFYGTSITHGASASRPGMVHTAILGRKLDVPVINLGFSGNGRMDAAVVALLTELDPSVYVIDCLPNLTAPDVAERTEPLVRTLRKARPVTPIVLVEDRTYTNAWLLPAPRKRNDDSRAAFKKAYQNLLAAGVKNLHYIDGENLLGDDAEGAVDSSHPTDLGFMRQAEAFQRVLEPILNKR